MSGTTVTLVRHASHGEVGTVLSGRRPGLALSDEGRRQAARLAESFRGERADAVLTSPMERARETAGAIAAVLDVAVTIRNELTEIDFGAWAGLSFAALEDDADWRLWNARRGKARTPAGDTMAAVGARIAAELDGWRARYPDGHVVAVSHGDVIKAALCGVLGLPLDRHAAFDVDPASRSTLLLWDGGGKVVDLNVRPAA